MAASQPANTDIKVFRTVRAQRDLPLHRSVFETFQRVTPLIMVVPGEEVTVTAVRDASTNVLNTTLVQGRSSGLPIVREVRNAPSLETAVESISDLSFPVVIGQDVFLEKTSANVGDDLHQDLRDVA